MSNELWSFSPESIFNDSTWSSPPAGTTRAHIVLKSKKDKWDVKTHAWAWPIGSATNVFKDPSLKYHAANGIVWVVDLAPSSAGQHGGQFDTSPYAMARDTVGAIYREAGTFDNVFLECVSADMDVLKGAVVGIEMSRYRFKNLWPERKKTSQKLFLQAPKIKSAKEIVAHAVVLGQAVNVARHLVNLPANVLYPNPTRRLQKRFLNPHPPKWNIGTMNAS